jgi:hypothetical protein
MRNFHLIKLPLSTLLKHNIVVEALHNSITFTGNSHLKRNFFSLWSRKALKKGMPEGKK